MQNIKKSNKKLTLISSTTLFLVGLSVYKLDQPISLYFKQLEHSELNTVARFITDIGLGEYWFGLALCCYGIFFSLRNIKLKNQIQSLLKISSDRLDAYQQKIKWFAHTLFFSLIVSGISVLTLKFIIGRQRPHKSELVDPYVFQFMTSDWHFHSMPSGHSQVLFASATSLALFLPQLRYLIFAIFLLLAFTRVITAQHFLSDVLSGALLGYTVTYLLYFKYIHNKKAN